MIAEFDFEKDLLDIIREEYDHVGMRFSEKKTLDEHLIDYLTVNQKIIPVIPRKVRISPPLIEKIIHHPKRAEIETIAERFKKGMNVNCFQSSRLLQSGRHDQLLYEWQICHLHLSTKQMKDKPFVERTDELLFVFIDGDTAIFLDVGDHNTEFAQLHWLEILDEYFPSEIKKYLHDEGIIPLDKNVSDKERSEIWEGGLSLCLTRVGDKVYSSPGVGRTTSGHSLMTITQANRIMQWIFTLQEQFAKYSKEMIEAFNLPKKPLHPKLIMDEKGGMQVIDKKTKYVYMEYLRIFNVEPIYE